jgi:hypothetical protein
LRCGKACMRHNEKKQEHATDAAGPNWACVRAAVLRLGRPAELLGLHPE